MSATTDTRYGYTGIIGVSHLLFALETMTRGTETPSVIDPTDTSAFLGGLYGEYAYIDEYELVETGAEPEDDGFWHPPYKWFIELPDFDPLPGPPCSPIVRYRFKPIRAPPNWSI